MRTFWIEPVSTRELSCLVPLKTYATSAGRLTFFQNAKRDPSQIFYGIFVQDQLQERVDPLEVDGFCAPYQPAYFTHTRAQLNIQSDGQWKLRIHQTAPGGGFYEAVVGAVTTVAGVVAIGAAGSAVLPLAGASALMGGGLSMFVTGVTRPEDQFDQEFAMNALKGAAGGAITGGVLGGGTAGAIIQRIGVRTIAGKQAVHAVVNATTGVMKACSDAAVDQAAGKKDASKNLSPINLLASAAGGAAGGFGGAHLGKQAAMVSSQTLRSAVTLVGGSAVGAAAGAGAGASVALLSNAVQGEENVTEGVKVAALQGAAAGVMTGCVAASRVATSRVAQAKAQEVVTKPQEIATQKTPIDRKQPQQIQQKLHEPQQNPEEKVEPRQPQSAQLPRDSDLLDRSAQALDQKVRMLRKTRLEPRLPIDAKEVMTREVERIDILRGILRDSRNIDTVSDKIKQLQLGESIVLPSGLHGQEPTLVLRQGNGWIIRQVTSSEELLRPALKICPTDEIYALHQFPQLEQTVHQSLTKVRHQFIQHPLAPAQLPSEILSALEAERIQEALKGFEQRLQIHDNWAREAEAQRQAILQELEDPTIRP